MGKSWMAMPIAVAARYLASPCVHWSGWQPDARPRIYYSNHTSHLDFVLLWSAIPSHVRRRTRPVAASDYWERVSLRRYLIHEVFHGVIVHRREAEGQDNFSPMLEALDKSESLIVFPEGTRGSGDGLVPFKSGIYHLAQSRPWIELVPVWISNAARVLPKGRLLPLPLSCSVTFGTPVHIEEQEEKAMFLERLRQQLLTLGRAA